MKLSMHFPTFYKMIIYKNLIHRSQSVMVLSVEIIDRSSPKPFLGGWRDVARDREYHDAVSQTPSWIVEHLTKAKKKPRVSILVQTSARCTRSVETLTGVDRAVQADACFPELTDRLVSVQDARAANRKRSAVVKIQRWYRWEMGEGVMIGYWLIWRIEIINILATWVPLN